MAQKVASHKVKKMRKPSHPKPFDMTRLLQQVTELSEKTPLARQSPQAGANQPKKEANTHPPPRQTPDRSTKAKQRSIPFNEEHDLDPWMLFPNLCEPTSALRHDSETYVRQAREAAAAREQRYCARRGSPLKYAELVDLVQMNYGIGKYAFPATTTMMTTTPTRSVGEPMELDW